MTQNEDAATLRKKLESLIVKDLESQLVLGKITGDRAGEVARLVLEMVPENISHEELLKVIPLLDDKASELSGVVLQTLSERDEQERTKRLEHIRSIIRGMQNG